MNLSFEQKISLQLGELIVEIKRLESINEQLKKQISEYQSALASCSDGGDVCSKNKVQS